jgi:hypothetical protein
MKLQTSTKRRLLTGLALALAAAAVVAPAGQARPEGMTPLQWQQWQADRADGSQGLSAVDRERIKSTAGSAGVSTSVTSLGHDRLQRGDLVTTSDTVRPIQAPAATTVEGSGFDWGDASIGAGGALVVALMLGAMLVAARRLSGGSQGRLAT